MIGLLNCTLDCTGTSVRTICRQDVHAVLDFQLHSSALFSVILEFQGHWTFTISSALLCARLRL